MKKIFFTLLLLSSLTLVGCNKDLNSNNKDSVSNITPVNQVNDIKTEINTGIIQNESTEKIVENKIEETNNNNDFLNKIPEKAQDINENIVDIDLGSGFILSQTDNESKINYKGETIKTYSHKSKEIPFAWDEGCINLTEKFDKIGNNGVGNWKQETWDSLGEKGQKLCIKENYKNTISIEKTLNKDFYTINKGLYGGVKKILFNTTTLKIYELSIYFDEINKIENGKNGVFILYKGNMGNAGGIVFIDNNGKEHILISNTDTGKNEENYIETTDFELLYNSKIKIIYKGQNLKIQEKIIDLLDIKTN